MNKSSRAKTARELLLSPPLLRYYLPLTMLEVLGGFAA